MRRETGFFKRLAESGIFEGFANVLAALGEEIFTGFEVEDQEDFGGAEVEGYCAAGDGEGI